MVLLVYLSPVPNTNIVKARGGGGGVKVDFPVFTYLIRAAGEEQEEKIPKITFCHFVNLIFQEQRQKSKF